MIEEEEEGTIKTCPHRLVSLDKMRRHRVFLLCTVGLCVISFLHYYKALHYVSLRELTAPYPFKSFILSTGFFWREKGLSTTPLSPASPEEPPPALPQRNELRAGASPQGTPLGIQGVAVGAAGEVVSVGLEVRVREPPAPPTHGTGPRRTGPETPKRYRGAEDQAGGPGPNPPKQNGLLFAKDSLSDPLEAMGDLHKRPHQLQDDPTHYFAHTKAGALCFRQGTEVATPKNPPERPTTLDLWQAPGEVRVPARLARSLLRRPHHGVPLQLPTKERLTPREVPRRVINAININHEFDLLHARFHELSQAVDLFIVCESNFTAYGERRPWAAAQWSYDYVRQKLLYVYLDHFPDGGRQDGWIADDYLRTFLTRNGMSVRDPAREGLMFLKLFDGWTEPFALHMRKSLYGFFWKQFGSLEVISGCTVGMLRDVYDSDGIKLRRREYYTMPGFRKYENDTGHILVQWSLGSPIHFAGWHCSWCFTPEERGLPALGDYEDKRDLNYIRQLIRTGGWFDGSLQEYPPADPKEHMYAPRYMLDNYKQYRYLLENPYSQV
ncbi:hypothetical protein WMY93_005567 [Mugilogobius chulae]|uniref:Beta-1,4-mannosyl-glycoprotein 4-beta-N-acetylglucosaminyltransferase n=1 Tax=Mugilogobius chulae TaxID=88201 RepID=A0AAW0PK29_9GOBI